MIFLQEKTLFIITASSPKGEELSIYRDPVPPGEERFRVVRQGSQYPALTVSINLHHEGLVVS
jgi:hypothetical protein